MKILLTCLIVISTSLSYGQYLTGIVLDSIWNEPIPFAKLYLEKSETSAIANVNGEFHLKILYGTDVLQVSSIGYEPRKITFSKNETDTILIKLSPNTTLNEVEVIASKTNPAFEILKRIHENAKLNNPDALDAYEYEAYNTIQFNLSNINEKFEDRALIKNFDFIVDYMDTMNGKKTLPFMFTESVSNYYYHKTPALKKEEMIASRVTGFSIISLDKYTGELFQKFNIYDNFIDIFNMDFMSPIALGSRGFYDYTLMGRDTVNGEPCFYMKFNQKRKGDATFNGEFWVSDASYAIVKVSATLPDAININYVSFLKITQHYTEVEKQAWFVENEDLEIHFKVLNDVKKAYLMDLKVYKNTSRKNIKVNPVRPLSFYVADVVLNDSSKFYSNEQWAAIRHQPLDTVEEGIIEMVDSLEQNPTFKLYKKISYLGYTGFWQMGPIELGSIYSLYQNNTVEGNRIFLSARTSNKFSRNHEISAYGIYGDLDKQFKYGGSYRWKFKHPNREILRFAYKKKIEQLSLSPTLGDIGNAFSTLLSVGDIDKLTMVDQFSVGFDKDYAFDMRTFSAVQWKKFTALQASDYQRVSGLDTLRINTITSFEIRNQIMYTKDEKFISGSFDRISLGSKYPIISLTHTLGIKSILGSQYNFNRLDFIVDHRPKLGVFGRLGYTLYAGKIFGTLPYPFLNVHEGNQSFYLQQSSMNLLRYYEFISDTWIGLNVEHRLQGFIMDRIPLVRKAKLRLVYGGKMVIGTLSNKHESEMLFPSFSNTLSFSKPYAEVSVGVENVLKFIRIDAIWRLTYLNHQDITKFGVKFVFTGDF
ncbi:hypothetical protein DNU06_14035 [Putridiphycobacter roseus]|uniref:Carboxypeptidase-like regulatory domain-containing protein n=1 Tax=Putridiphycobacter roseus TaxID=2219161 RepID=A0A2W1MXZ2_9FLAO|nr:DUF5686 and carboxypeptidase-like regulatory domain-containing protein [Putridiphycobacter roseus]PZE16244.1 hypothetical protein DNU06_14035 [Putridiphycobacter roseus]